MNLRSCAKGKGSIQTPPTKSRRPVRGDGAKAPKYRCLTVMGGTQASRGGKVVHRSRVSAPVSALASGKGMGIVSLRDDT